MKTLADLKRALAPGRKLALVYRHKKLEKPIKKEVIAAQSNGVTLTKERKEGRSWLDYPKASLLEITKKGFKVFSRGKRLLTKREKEIRDGYERQRNPDREGLDLLSDGSSSYWAAVRYFKEKGASYLKGDKFERGAKYDYTSGLVWDDRVRGALCLEYVFV